MGRYVTIAARARTVESEPPCIFQRSGDEVPAALIARGKCRARSEKRVSGWASAISPLRLARSPCVFDVVPLGRPAGSGAPTGVERLVNVLTALGRDVDILVTALANSRKHGPFRINAA